MRRAPLAVFTLGLLLLVLADRSFRALFGARGRPVQGVSETQPAIPASPSRRSVRGEPLERGALEGGALRARSTRLAARRQLDAEAGQTYLDSLIANTDSVIRRWPDRGGSSLRVCISNGDGAAWAPRMVALVREALDRWEHAGIGVRFAIVADPGSADITVHWIDHFDIDRAGQTDLTWDQGGRVRKAAISLALRTAAGVTLPDEALLAVAVHETGHALGLPHSADSMDAMFPATRTGTLSPRDRRTALVLYQLPAGPLRDARRTR